MTELIKIESRTGCVHIVGSFKIEEKSGWRHDFTTLCGRRETGWKGRRRELGWKVIQTFPVDCRLCLAKSESPPHRLKELSIKASDLESDFNQLAKKCEFFFLEDKENADIFHDFQLKFCSHRRRLGTEKYPKQCNLLECPLKYKTVR